MLNSPLQTKVPSTPTNPENAPPLREEGKSEAMERMGGRKGLGSHSTSKAIRGTASEAADLLCVCVCVSERDGKERVERTLAHG